MSAPPAPASRLPWIVAAVLAVLVALLALAFVHVHTASRNHARNPYGDGYSLTADQQGAVTAAATEAANIITYSRKTFDADYQRALNGATGSLRSDMNGKKSATLNAMTTGKYDLKGTVAASAYVGTTPDGKSLQVLVTLNGFTVADTPSNSQNTVQRLILTMVRSGKSWLATDLTASGIQ